MRPIVVNVLATCLLGTAPGLYSAAYALNFYVSPENVHGEEQKNFSSLSKAQQAVRDVISKGMNEDIIVLVADGTYYLPDGTLNFSSADSGQNGHTVYWQASGSAATISAGMKVSGWIENATTGIWHASIPKGTQSRNLFVNGWAAQYARTSLNRTYFKATNTSYAWDNSEYDWLMTTPGISSAEIRSIQSFTDHYAPIKAVGDRELIMAQYTWQNQICCWDDIADPYADFGLYVQNALALLDEGGEFYVDSDADLVYYMPLDGEDMTTAETYLGLLEAVISISGTYEDPAHDISFENLNFQTGGYIGANVSYPAFEAARSHWYQNPGGIQISAAHNIRFTGGSYTQMGAGGFGIGQDPNACISGIGLGAKNITVSKGYFTQVMGNGITAGGIQIPAHHPNNSAMINSEIHVTENIFWNMSSLFSSCVPILYTYVQYSSIINNDVYYTPYSGICHGYGWGMNDAGGSDIYVGLGTYKYQPIFTTPTTLMNNLIQGNLVHGYGFSHTDLGAIYTLSKSPSTYFLENYAFNATWNGLYTDEGSNSMIFINNSMMEQGGHGYGWYNPNQGSGTTLNPGMHTANNTFIDNFGEYEPGRDFTDAPNGTGILNNTFLRNFVVDDLIDTDAFGQRVAYRAGIPPASRASRPVSNPPVLDMYATLIFPERSGEDLVVDIWNFDDMDFIHVSFESSTGHATNSPSTIPADDHVLVMWRLPPVGCGSLEIKIMIKYTNSRTGEDETYTVSGTMPGYKPLGGSWLYSSTWPAALGESCDKFGVRTGGRNFNGTYDDWAVIYTASAIGLDGSVSASVMSIDGINPNSSAGVAIRDSFQADSPPNDAKHVNATGYAAVFVTYDGHVSFAWDANGTGYLTDNTMIALAASLPVELRLNVSDATFSGSYRSKNDNPWIQIGSAVKIPRKASISDAGVIANSHGGYRSGTAIFGDVIIS